MGRRHKPIRLIIAGGRDFDNYELLKLKCDSVLEGWLNVEIITGKASGADSLGEQYANDRNYPTIAFPADWNTHGQSAGYLRNKKMAEYGTACIVFWDGKSRGSKHMIDLAKENNLPLRVIRY
jgi:hypothetical protein